MARSAEAPSCFLFSISLFLLLLSPNLGRVHGSGQEQKTWCVAKPSSDDSALENNINFACSQVDCSILQSGYPCFNPDKLISHASVAMNLYYQAKGRNYWNCYFSDSALTVTTDPSYGSCAYA
ncbi:Glucan endo-1,3-beta-D-glucosidase [Apostasia shenzhenica]|uniref:Glucan endo-1,3-beta-D-glucosidase n=1 Tax=Apostasia shenzhenica TaxID=1088818 RepID=A0A2I0AJ64_9ASPA|nr:Glucan endo-1,3-beta-D-glucosidase [Apostasia shenzhenica]